MGAPLVSAVQSKGGSCKTSTSIMLVLAAIEQGARVLFLDGDQNADGSRYLSKLKLDNLTIELISEETVSSAITKHEEKVDIIIADTAGGRSGLSVTMLNISDLSLIPVMRSKHDVTNAVATLQDIKNQSRRNPNIMNSFRVLWSNVPHRIANRTEKSYVEQFNAASDVPCFNTQMKNRPIIEIFTDNYINPYEFIKSPMDFLHLMKEASETITDKALVARTYEDVKKAKSLIDDANDVYFEVLQALNEVTDKHAA